MIRMLRWGALLVVAVVVGTGAAQAAGPESDWSGAYLGAFAGYSWADLDYEEPAFPGFDRHPTIHGVTGGLLLGWQHRVDRLVLGLEADGGVGDLKDRPDGTDRNAYSAFEIDWTAHLRARVGVAADATLLFVAGGLALAEVTVNDSDPFWGEDDAVHLGWTLGAGVEHALTEHLRVRVEYLYDDFGDQDYTITGFIKYKAEVDLTAHTVRVGLAYRF